jgi:hypothetical protein
MALAACDFNVRSDGSDTNGGGFKIGGSGTDYSQQSAAEVVYSSELSCDAASTTVTDSGANGYLDSSHVGNLIYITNSGDWVAGPYEITAVNSPNEFVVDRTPTNGVDDCTSGTGYIGGALATPGGAMSVVNGNAIEGHRIHVRAATYTLTTTTPNVSGGPIDLSDFMAGKRCLIEGYETTYEDWGTAPEINCGSYAPTAIITLDGADDNDQVVNNLVLDGNSQSVSGIIGDSRFYCRANSITVKNCDGSYGFRNVNAFQCKAEGCTATPFSNSYTNNCWADACASPYAIDSCNGRDCLITNHTGRGFFVLRDTVANCTLYNCSGSGFYSFGTFANAWVNCLSIANGSYGWENADGCTLINCAGDGNASGDVHETPLTNVSFYNITTSPSKNIFMDADNGDFRLNPASADYASLAGMGMGVAGQTDNRDIGAVQHADPSSGGGRRPRMQVIQ